MQHACCQPIKSINGIGWLFSALKLTIHQIVYNSCQHVCVNILAAQAQCEDKCVLSDLHAHDDVNVSETAAGIIHLRILCATASSCC